jgi:hypothetical protein
MKKYLTKGIQSLLILILQGAKKAIFFTCYNLAIYVVNFFEKNSTHSFNSLRQDPTVGTQKKEI